MTINNAKYLILILLIPLAAACEDSLGVDKNVHSEAKDDTSAINKANEYLPLEVGNYWIYESVTLDKEGNVLGYPVERRLQIFSEGNYLGKDCYIWKHWDLNGDYHAWHYSCLEKARYFWSREFIMLFPAFSPQGNNGREPFPEPGFMTVFDLSSPDSVFQFGDSFEFREVLDDIYFTGDFVTYSRLLPDSVIIYDGTPVNSIGFELRCELTGEIHIAGEKTIISPSPYVITHRYYYGKGLGFIYAFSEYPEHNWGFGEMPFFRWEMNLKQHNCDQ